ncbi:semaphorin-2A-like isoform X2 [Mytilus trossulus]|uniref:semaphorin-2A-like isoform X2 n=1 Tax=Mytilus trossulus TaxID=6551 RepID=UPI003006D765
MAPKIFQEFSIWKLNLYLALLLTLETVLTYDLRDSIACASFYKDELNITTYSTDISQASYYRFLLVDPKAKYLLVGSMNKVTILNLENIASTKQVIDLKPDQDKLNYCTYQKPETPNCQNHIRFITNTTDSADSPEYYLCGTNALSPAGYKINHTASGEQFQVTNLGGAACSDDPFSNLTAIYVKNGNPNDKELMYYGATAFDRSTIYRPIERPDGVVAEFMKGVFSNKWMKNPQFAGSFSVDERVFFFFREIAVETEFIETKLYSRVGKVCKKDVGGDSLLRNKWTSYQKARLNCSLSGAFPLYFDVIQDVVSVDENTFYGLFTTYANGLPASAICAFEKSEIDRVLNGPFKTQDSDMSFWTEAKASTVPSPRPGQCYNDSLKTADTVLGFIVDHPLMHETVQHKYGKPVFYLPGEELQQIEMEAAPGVQNGYVFFAGSNRGKVYKIASQDKGQEYKTYVSSIYSPFDETQVIWSLKHHDKYVYLGTDHKVTQINVQNDCGNHQCVDSCIYDPYCVWDKTSDQCVHYTHKSSDKYWNFDNFDPLSAEHKNEFVYSNGKNVTKVEYGTLKMTLSVSHFFILMINMI